MVAPAGIVLGFLCCHSVCPGQCRAEVLGQLVSLLLLSCAQQQRHRHSPLSVPCYWYLSCRGRVLSVGFSFGVCCVPVILYKILLKKQKRFLPGLLLLLRVGQKEQCCISCVLFRGPAGRCLVVFWGELQQFVPPVRGHDSSRCNSYESAGCYTQEQPR